MRTEEPNSESRAHGGVFATTHWSVVLAASDGKSPQAAAALEQLCQTYWYPLYAYVRRQGRTPEDAEDLTQDFFAHLLAKGFPSGATPERGRFRSFLLASLQHFLVDQHRHTAAAKRGGGARLISLDQAQAEERFRLEPHYEWTPERLFEREWAMALLQHAESRLREEYSAAGKSGLHEQLKGYRLKEKNEASLAETAAEFGITAVALKAAIHRFRARYRQLVRDEVAHTVADPAELKEEARYLIALIAA